MSGILRPLQVCVCVCVVDSGVYNCVYKVRTWQVESEVVALYMFLPLMTEACSPAPPFKNVLVLKLF